MSANIPADEPQQIPVDDLDAFKRVFRRHAVAIHTLGPRTRHLAEKLAGDNSLRFEGEHWKPGPYGVPILEGVTSWMLGRVIEVHPVFNNAVIVVQIETGALGPEDEALLYHERTYRTPGPVV
jgi:flavin reductase (DIM6/NTAB) family NADH-FMN oxidoreductase RutF